MKTPVSLVLALDLSPVTATMTAFLFLTSQCLEDDQLIAHMLVHAGYMAPFLPVQGRVVQLSGEIVDASLNQSVDARDGVVSGGTSLSVIEFPLGSRCFYFSKQGVSSNAESIGGVCDQEDVNVGMVVCLFGGVDVDRRGRGLEKGRWEIRYTLLERMNSLLFDEFPEWECPCFTSG